MGGEIIRTLAAIVVWTLIGGVLMGTAYVFILLAAKFRSEPPRERVPLGDIPNLPEGMRRTAGKPGGGGEAARAHNAHSHCHSHHDRKAR
jgi:hypothetical protein